MNRGRRGEKIFSTKEDHWSFVDVIENIVPDAERALNKLAYKANTSGHQPDRIRSKVRAPHPGGYSKTSAISEIVIKGEKR
jgi:hypothetical protein